MKYPLVVLGALVLCWAHPVLAQTDGGGVWPLQEGNTWRFYSMHYAADGSIDTTYHTVRLDAPQVVEGQAYYAYTDQCSTYLLRTDDDGRVWRRVDGGERLWIDPTVSPGESYTYAPPDESGLSYDVRVQRRTIRTEGGHFVDALRFDFDDPLWADEEYTYVLFPGIGVVEYYCNMAADFGYLVEAIVNGQVVTSAETSPSVPGEATTLAAYPNPFSEVLTIEAAAAPATRVQVAVYDLLGRRVRTLHDGWGASTLQLRWDGRDAAGDRVADGVYLVRVHAGTQIQTHPVVLAR
ncbi:MAG: T9SS type A sorting domain-containing protein [Bacteroidetes bacterium]|jgi:hypothetical protein|nr:T9SS type A sorting domain-containing protein [Bacteroidota bacterium]